MSTFQPYLNYAGDCMQAFEFYKSILGGEFASVNYFKDVPPQEGQSIPESDGEKIMHITLVTPDGTTLFGSDTIEGFGPPLIKGNNFSLYLNAKNTEEADRLFSRLSEGGQSLMPMNKTFWGSYFGMLTDKFGISWMVAYDEMPQSQSNN